MSAGKPPPPFRGVFSGVPYPPFTHGNGLQCIAHGTLMYCLPLQITLFALSHVILEKVRPIKFFPSESGIGGKN